MLLQQAVNALTLGSLYALIAIGLAITFSILDVANFAQGSMVVWGAYLGVVFAVAAGLGFWLLMLGAMCLDRVRPRHPGLPEPDPIRVVMQVSDRVAVLNHGELIAEGSPEVVRRDRGVIAAYLGESA